MTSFFGALAGVTPLALMGAGFFLSGVVMGAFLACVALLSVR